MLYTYVFMEIYIYICSLFWWCSEATQWVGTLTETYTYIYIYVICLMFPVLPYLQRDGCEAHLGWRGALLYLRDLEESYMPGTTHSGEAKRVSTKVERERCMVSTRP